MFATKFRADRIPEELAACCFVGFHPLEKMMLQSDGINTPEYGEPPGKDLLSLDFSKLFLA